MCGCFLKGGGQATLTDHQRRRKRVLVPPEAVDSAAQVSDVGRKESKHSKMCSCRLWAGEGHRGSGSRSNAGWPGRGNYPTIHAKPLATATNRSEPTVCEFATGPPSLHEIKWVIRGICVGQRGQQRGQLKLGGVAVAVPTRNLAALVDPRPRPRTMTA